MHVGIGVTSCHQQFMLKVHVLSFFLKLEFSFRDLVQNGENYWLLCETNMVLLSDMFDNQAHYLQGSLTP